MFPFAYRKILTHTQMNILQKNNNIFISFVSECHGCNTFVDFDRILPKDVAENSFEYVPGYVSKQEKYTPFEMNLNLSCNDSLKNS